VVHAWGEHGTTQNGWHGNAGYQATAPGNLHFMAAYFKNAKVYKHQFRQIYSAQSPGRVTSEPTHNSCHGKDGCVKSGKKFWAL